MTDLRDLLRRAAPAAPDFDEQELLRTLGKRKQRRRVALVSSVAVLVAAATVGVVARGRSDRHAIVVTPSPTSAPSVSSVPSSTLRPTTPSTSPPTRAAVGPIQSSAMPTEAFVAVGSSLVAIDTHNVARRRTLTGFPNDAGINWVTVDSPRGRVYFGVTSGCDPGVNGMYEMSTGGGSLRKIAPTGDRAAVSPDGTKLAYSVQTDGCGSEKLIVQDIASGRQQSYSGHRSIQVGGWSSDGQSLFLDAYDGSTPAVFLFHPFAAGAALDRSERWYTGIAEDAGGGRVAILDWCAADPPSGVCVVGARTRSDRASGPDYSFGRDANVSDLSIDASGQWPLRVTQNPPHDVVSFFAEGKWQELAPGNAADW